MTLSANAARTGIDLAWVDAEVRPQDDLFSHVNGRWLCLLYTSDAADE